MGLLSFAQPAQAGIIYTPTNVSISSGTLSIILTNNAIDQFQLTDLFSFSKGARRFYGSAAVRFLSVNGLGNPSNQVVFKSGYAAALQAGVPIGPGGAFGDGSHERAWGVNTYPGNPVHGLWASVSDEYLGLQFQINGQTYYGWAELSVSGFAADITATLQRYAYNNVAGQQIQAGQTSPHP